MECIFISNVGTACTCQIMMLHSQMHTQLCISFHIAPYKANPNKTVGSTEHVNHTFSSPTVSGRNDSSCSSRGHCRRAQGARNSHGNNNPTRDSNPNPLVRTTARTTRPPHNRTRVSTTTRATLPQFPPVFPVGRSMSLSNIDKDNFEKLGDTEIRVEGTALLYF